MCELAAVWLVLQQYTLNCKRYAESQRTIRKIDVLQIRGFPIYIRFQTSFCK